MSSSRIGFYGASVVALLALSGGAFGATLTEIPAWTGYVDNAQTKLFTPVNAEARGITPDGQFVVSHSDGTVTGDVPYTTGFIWDATNGSRFLLAEAAWGFETALGVTYRNNGGAQQLVVFGKSSGGPSYATSSDGGLTWAKAYRNLSITKMIHGTANLVGATGADDVFYGTWLNEQAGDDPMAIDKLSGSPVTGLPAYKNVTTETSSHGMSGTGLAVGRRKRTSSSPMFSIYVGQFTTTNIASWNYLKGFEPVVAPANNPPTWPTDYTDVGEAWAVSVDGTKIFGVSPIVNGETIRYPFRMVVTPSLTGVPTQNSIQLLPLYPDVAGSVRGHVYGCSPDGTWAVGHNARGLERAVVWDLRDAAPNNWKVYDLTAYFGAMGQLGNFTRMDRAYSVTVDAANQEVVVAGRGATPAGTRPFVARIPLSAFPLPDTGACCMVGSCTSKFAADCPNLEGQQSWSANTLCINAGCPGACCHANGTCSDFVSADACVGEGDIARGASSSCATACQGACCDGQNTCVTDNYGVCPAEDFKGVGTTCEVDGLTCGCSSTYHVWADQDMDGDVDQEDFGQFQACFTGSVAGVAAGCECFNRVAPEGATIDETDLNAFQDCATGAEVQWSASLTPACQP